MSVLSVLSADLELDQQVFARAAIGMAYLGGNGNILKANGTFCRMIGYEADELATLGWAAIFHRDDWPVAWRQPGEVVLCETLPSSVETRLRHRRGHAVECRLTFSVLRNEPDSIVLVQAQELAASQEATAFSSMRVAELLEHLGAGILVEDERPVVRLANATFCRLLELETPSDRLPGRSGQALGRKIASRTSDPLCFTSRIAELRTRRAETRRERLSLADGRTLERDYVPFEFPGESRGQMWVYRDVTNRVEAEKFNHEQNLWLRESNGRLAALASTDALTNLPNRRSLLERLLESLRQGSRDSEPVSLALVDVDRFKEFNDVFGHPAGDEVLKGLAGLFRQAMRMGDVPARFGGEEFAILLPRTAAAEAARVAERCRRSLERAAWPMRPITASFGVATLLPSSGQEDAAAHILIAAADAALYRSKAAGRNCVTHAEDPFGESS